MTIGIIQLIAGTVFAIAAWILILRAVKLAAAAAVLVPGLVFAFVKKAPVACLFAAAAVYALTFA